MTQSKKILSQTGNVNKSERISGPTTETANFLARFRIREECHGSGATEN
jgi:hypothetical protein